MYLLSFVWSILAALFSFRHFTFSLLSLSLLLLIYTIEIVYVVLIYKLVAGTWVNVYFLTKLMQNFRISALCRSRGLIYSNCTRVNFTDLFSYNYSVLDSGNGLECGQGSARRRDERLGRSRQPNWTRISWWRPMNKIQAMRIL